MVNFIAKSIHQRKLPVITSRHPNPTQQIKIKKQEKKIKGHQKTEKQEGSSGECQ
jgi:hypothetical protein